MATGTQTQRVSANDFREANAALRQFTKAMDTIRGRYPKRADSIIARMMGDKFGQDATLGALQNEYDLGRYDLIVARMRQADRARATEKKLMQITKQELLDEMTAIYCGVNKHPIENHARRMDRLMQAASL